GLAARRPPALRLPAADLHARGTGSPAAEEILERLLEPGLRPGEGDPVLGPAGPGDARLDGREVERERVRVLGRRRIRRVEEALLLHVCLDQPDLLLRAAGEAQVAKRLLIDREDAD